MMPKRMIAGNDWSPLSRVDDHAVIGPAKAMPVSTANGHREQQAPRPGRREQRQHDGDAGRGERRRAWRATAPTPAATSPGRSGVAAIAR